MHIGKGLLMLALLLYNCKRDETDRFTHTLSWQMGTAEIDRTTVLFGVEASRSLDMKRQREGLSECHLLV